jgi:hypothetical protein
MMPAHQLKQLMDVSNAEPNDNQNKKSAKQCSDEKSRNETKFAPNPDPIVLTSHRETTKTKSNDACNAPIMMHITNNAALAKR